MAQLRVAQQRRKRNRMAWLGVTAAAVVAVIVAVTLSLTAGGGKTKVKTAASTPTTSASSTTTPGSSTTVPGSTSSSAVAPTSSVPISVPLLAAPANVGCPKANGSSPHYTKFQGPPPTCIDPTKTYTATMQTDVGTITLQLLPKVAPIAVNNFVFLAGYHFYDGTVFHRVIPGFVDQGGDPTGTGGGGPGYKFKDELPKSPSVYTNGALAMANSGANTNGSQFFIVSGNNGPQELQPLYTYFGKTIGGLAVVAKINADGTSSGTPKVMHKIIKLTISVT
jgi:cyclophilin family peptidyl-prolyl cis-trans isomerase